VQQLLAWVFWRFATLDETSAMAKPLCFCLGKILVWKRRVLSYCCTSAPRNPWVYPSTPPHPTQPSHQLLKWCRDVALVQTQDSSLLLLSTRSVEKNPNCNNKNLHPNRLISMKKLFPGKESVRGCVQ